MPPSFAFNLVDIRLDLDDVAFSQSLSAVTSAFAVRGRDGVGAGVSVLAFFRVDSLNERDDNVSLKQSLAA